MAETGILRPDERLELLNGRILEKPPMGPRHAYVVAQLTALMQNRYGDRAIVRVQLPVSLDRWSEPEPDVILSRPPRERYVDAHPRPGDSLLAIEVADSSLNVDRGEKLRAYAASGVAEYWIINLVAERVEVHVEPDGDRFRFVTIAKRGERVAPRAFPHEPVAVDELLPPPTR